MDGRNRGRRAARRFAALLATVLGVALLPAAASADTPTQVIRTAPEDRVPNVTDLAATASRVAVVWTETDDGFHGSDDPIVNVRTSPDRGATWDPRIRLGSLAQQTDQGRVAICDGRYLLVAYAVDLRNELFSNRWHIILYHRDLVTDLADFEEMSTGIGRAQWPDVACADDRAWLIWDDKDDDGKRHVFLRHAIVGPPGSMAWVPAIDLGRSRPTGSGAGNGPAVAAVNGEGYAAWGAPGDGNGVLVRFKRFEVGGGPSHPVSPGATVTLQIFDGSPTHPLLTASGDRVVVAYSLDFERIGVRRSTNRGDTFRSQQILRLPQNPAGLGGWPTHLSMRGQRVLLLVPVYLKGPADTVRYLSADGGASFSRQKLDDNRGNRVGGIVVVGGQTRYVEAWDGHWYNARKLRFHRET